MTTGAENTRVEVMYRDADNYKVRDVHVFVGLPTPELTHRLAAALDEGDKLKPATVGLRHPATTDALFMVRFPDPAVDHDWVELDVAADVAATRFHTTDARTFADFVADCERAADAGWDAA